MPLTDKGDKIKGAMEKQYGDKEGEQVFYASKNKGVISGVDEAGKMAVAAARFDDLRDETHALSKRLDDCAATDDRSSEGHEEAAAALPEGAEKTFHKAEVGRTDDDCAQ
jgi:hypothetical protein